MATGCCRGGGIGAIGSIFTFGLDGATTFFGGVVAAVVGRATPESVTVDEGEGLSPFFSADGGEAGVTGVAGKAGAGLDACGLLLLSLLQLHEDHIPDPAVR